MLSIHYRKKTIKYENDVKHPLQKEDHKILNCDSAKKIEKIK